MDDESVAAFERASGKYKDSRANAVTTMASTYHKPVVYLSPTTSVRGEILTIDDSEKPVYTFNTIPFAKPPVANLRFKKPVPIDLWEGEKDVRKEGHSAAASTAFNEFMEMWPLPSPASYDEDCLNLMISSPDISGTRKLPVMVYFYGGGFQVGSIYHYPGTALASIGDVVYVAIAYRVNIFGFFTTGDDVCPGNFGLWDQIEGLRWIQKYISKFGGNPNNVTIFGESAGGWSVSLHHVMPQSKDLFQRSVAQSGVASCTGAMLETKANIKQQSEKTAKALGLEENASSEALFAAINALTSEKVIEKFAKMKYAPCIDNDLLTDSYYNLYLAKKFHPKNSIIGVNTHESAGDVRLFYGDMFGGLKTLVDFKKYIVHYLTEWNPRMAKEEQIDAIVNEYLPTADPPAEDIYKAAIDVMGDMHLITPPLEAAKLHSGVASMGTYVYVYGYRISFSENKPYVGADHGDDLGLVFGIPFLTKTVTTKKKFDFTPEDKAMSKILISYWTNFAKTGNPNGTGLQDWKLHTPDEPNFLFIDKKCSQGTDYKASMVKFWRETLPNM